MASRENIYRHHVNIQCPSPSKNTPRNTLKPSGNSTTVCKPAANPRGFLSRPHRRGCRRALVESCISSTTWPSTTRGRCVAPISSSIRSFGSRTRSSPSPTTTDRSPKARSTETIPRSVSNSSATHCKNSPCCSAWAWADTTNRWPECSRPPAGACFPCRCSSTSFIPRRFCGTSPPCAGGPQNDACWMSLPRRDWVGWAYVGCRPFVAGRRCSIRPSRPKRSTSFPTGPMTSGNALRVNTA